MTQTPSMSSRSSHLAVRLLDGLEWLLFVLGMAALLGIVGLVFMQVVFRYLLQIGLPWPEELSRYLHITLVFLALAHVMRTGDHLRVDLLFRRLPRPVRTFSLTVFLLIQLAASIVIAYGAVGLVQQLGHTRTPAVGMPLTLFFLPTILGFAVFALECVRQTLASLLRTDQHAISPAGVQEDVT